MGYPCRTMEALLVARERPPWLLRLRAVGAAMPGLLLLLGPGPPPAAEGAFDDSVGDSGDPRGGSAAGRGWGGLPVPLLLLSFPTLPPLLLLLPLSSVLMLLVSLLSTPLLPPPLPGADGASSGVGQQTEERKLLIEAPEAPECLCLTGMADAPPPPPTNSDPPPASGSTAF